MPTTRLPSRDKAGKHQHDSIKGTKADPRPTLMTSKSEIVLGRFKSEPLAEARSAVRSESELALGRLNSEPLSKALSAVTSRSELVSSRFKSQPLKFQPGLPGSSLTGAAATCDFPVSRKKAQVPKESCRPHLKSSAAPIDGRKETKEASRDTMTRSESELALVRINHEPLASIDEAATADRSKSELAIGRFNSEPFPKPVASDAMTFKSELVLGRFKSEPLKFQPGLLSSLAHARATSYVNFSRQKVFKGNSPPHLKSSAAPIDNGPKSRTSSGSAFYSTVIARQVFQAAKQVAKKAKSGPIVKPPQKVPRTLLSPSPVSLVGKIIASLLGLLILGWHVCIYTNLWCLASRMPER